MKIDVLDDQQMGEPFYGLNKVFEWLGQIIGQLEWKSPMKAKFCMLFKKDCHILYEILIIKITEGCLNILRFIFCSQLNLIKSCDRWYTITCDH